MAGPPRFVEPRTRFSVGWYRAVLVVFFGSAAVAMASLMVSARANPAAVACCVVTGGVFTIATVRSVRSATIVFDEREVVLYGLLRTRRVPWSDVREVGVTQGTSMALVSWRVPYFELADGTTVLADEIRSLRESSIVDEVVAEARRRLG